MVCDHELINAKLVKVEYALDTARNAMEVHVAWELHTGRPIERYLCDAHHVFAPEGTSDVQLLRLGGARWDRRGQRSERLAGRLETAPERLLSVG